MIDTTSSFAIVFLNQTEDVKAINEFLIRRGNRPLFELSDPSDISKSSELVEFFSQSWRRKLSDPHSFPVLPNDSIPIGQLSEQIEMRDAKNEDETKEEEEDDCIIIEPEIRKKRKYVRRKGINGINYELPKNSGNKYHKGIPKFPPIDSRNIPSRHPFTMNHLPSPSLQPPRVHVNYSVNNVPVSLSTFSALASNAPIAFAHPRRPSMASNLPSMLVPLPSIPPHESSHIPSIPAISSQEKDPFKKPPISLKRPHITLSMEIAKKISVIQYAASNRQPLSAPTTGNEMPSVPMLPHHHLSSSILSIKPFPFGTDTPELKGHNLSATPSILPSIDEVSKHADTSVEEHLSATEVSSRISFSRKRSGEFHSGIDQLPDETDTCYRCHLCDEMVKKVSVRHHITKHLPFNKYQCKFCCFSSTSSYKIERHQSTVHEVNEDIRVIENTMTFAAIALISRKCFPLHNTRECAIIRAKSYPQMDELHKCVICEKDFNPSLTACHIIDCHLHTTIYNCILCNFKTIFKRLLVIHSQASHDCDLSMTIIGSNIDFTDDSLFLVKSFFPSLINAADPNCEPELVRMESVFAASFDKANELTSLVAKQNGCSDALNQIIDEEEACNICLSNGISCFGKTVYDIALHVKSHVSEGECQWCCPSSDCSFSALFKIDVDRHLHTHHRQNSAVVVNRWDLLYPLWKEAFKKCYPSLSASGIKFPSNDLPPDPSSNEDKYAIAE